MGTEDKQVVIIGGGFAGLQAARHLASAPIQVTLVDRANHHLFQPLLYQVATAGLAPGSIAVPIRAVLSRQKNARVFLGEAVNVDKDLHRVHLRDGTELPYDYLVVAVGARTNYFGRDEWAKHAAGLKDLPDAIGLRERILLAFEKAEREDHPEARARALTFVVIGAGPTGVEMAGAISELGRQVLAGDFRRIAPQDIRVVLVEMGDAVLGSFHPDLQFQAAQQLRELDVELKLGERVVEVGEDHVTIEPREGGASEVLTTSVVVWATGVQPAPLIKTLNVATDRSGRAKVDQNCALLGQPEIFVVGDCASFTPDGENEALPGLAPVAIQQGRHVAEQIRNDLRRRTRKPFRYADKGTMATIGRSRAVVQGPFQLSGFAAWLAWCFIHVMYLIGFRNRFIVMFNWFWSYLTFKRGARLITARPELSPSSNPSTKSGMRGRSLGLPE